MSSSYKEKLIKHFLEDVKKTPTDFLISKDLPDCTLEEIEWVTQKWSMPPFLKRNSQGSSPCAPTKNTILHK